MMTKYSTHLLTMTIAVVMFIGLVFDSYGQGNAEDGPLQTLKQMNLSDGAALGLGAKDISTLNEIPLICLNPGQNVNEEMPVALLEATLSSRDGQGVEIEWITSSERDNEFFVLEYTDDNIEWKETNKIMGAGVSSTPRTYYSYLKIPVMSRHRNLALRIRQVNFDGSTRIIFEEAFSLKKKEEEEAVSSLKPSKYLLISGNSDYVKSLTFSSADGQVVKEMSIPDGISRLDASELVPVGYYTVHIKGMDNEVLASKKVSVFE